MIDFELRSYYQVVWDVIIPDFLSCQPSGNCHYGHRATKKEASVFRSLWAALLWWYKDCALLCVITLKSHAEQASDFLIQYINHCNSIRQRFGSLLLHTVDYMNSKLFHVTALLIASSRICLDDQNCEHGTQVPQTGKISL